MKRSDSYPKAMPRRLAPLLGGLVVLLALTPLLPEIDLDSALADGVRGRLRPDARLRTSALEGLVRGRVVPASLTTGPPGGTAPAIVYTLRYFFAARPDLTAPGRLPDPWADGPEACCRARKGEPLDAFLAGRSAWMTGLRRADSPERAATPVVQLDQRGLVKVNPLAAWTDDDVDRYVAEHDPVANPLLFEGYPSIGCWPCTEPVDPADDARAGRWAGLGKTECGIHL